MKIKIWTNSQSEFDEKRSELAKSLAGDDYELIRKAMKLPEYRKPFYKAQGEIQDYWDTKFKELLEDIKKDINEILEENI